ncbi:hypothetical protein [Streptomyces sp. NPDC007264]|uniref:hypothetical protein n=1 Tax=Streptomyces sp. NPDC007264 TaxID=3364777 RepID=UPI0036DE41A9
MPSYLFAAVRRAAAAVALLAVFCGAAMTAAVLTTEDAATWSAALYQGVVVGLVLGAVLLASVALSNTWQAARTASRHGLTLVAEAATVPCTAEFRAPVPSGTTPYQLSDSVLHTLKKARAPRIGEVKEFTHGRLTLVFTDALACPVRFHISIGTDRDTATVIMEARPVSPRRRLDGGASWSVLTALEPLVSKAVHAETAPES